MRILENLYFHSLDESRYIADLKNALVAEGILDDRTVEKELKLKDGFKESDFYKSGLIFRNKKIPNKHENVESLKDLGIKDRDFQHNLYSLKGDITKALTAEKFDNLKIKKITETKSLSEIDNHIIRAAINKKEFFKFNNIKKYFPNINSINDLIKNTSYLADVKIIFSGTSKDIKNISINNKELFNGVLSVLDAIENSIKLNAVDYKGTKIFYAKKISEEFTDKIVKREIDSEQSKGQIDFLKDKEWYVFNANYGTSHEKKCVELFDRLIEENFKNQYDEIYLIRNELHFLIYNFDDGRGFALILFCL